LNERRDVMRSANKLAFVSERLPRAVVAVAACFRAAVARDDMDVECAQGAATPSSSSRYIEGNQP
jgi:hypothetical protein